MMAVVGQPWPRGGFAMDHALRLVGLALIGLVVACAPPEESPRSGDAPPPAADGGGVESSRVDYQAALAAPGRLASDREQDATRKPVEVLEFFGVQPGMSVLDLYSGDGYYTELLAAVVGPTGRVVAHNNTAYLTGAEAQLAERFADPKRLANVERVTAEANELELPPGRFDFVLLSSVYHDVYFVDEARNWPKIDGPRLLAELHAGMKSGATLGVIDHAARPGAPSETGGTLHRIDPNVVKRDFAAAGFVLADESALLRNAADDLAKHVFDPAVRGRTDRFILYFRRP